MFSAHADCRSTRRLQTVLLLGIIVLVGLVLPVVWEAAGQTASAAAPRALPDNKLPADARLQPLKDLNGYFPFEAANSKAEWEKRARAVKRRMLVSQGLWPMPTKTPLNPVIHGLIDQGDYTIEKAYFESFPGFYVTGSLYRPKDAQGRVPGVLCPHGHWSNGRFHDAGQAAVLKQIEQGAERFADSGRSPLQARCVQLARMGCVVFHYDMIGYADCTQISFELAHRFAKQRPEMNAVENWGLFSPQAESHLQSVMGMQTYNSIRALDFLTGLPDVDPQRIAVTGASGGGTQTFMLSAIDPRVKVSVPAVMVSTAMQGGCTCENASLLRIGTGNVEFAALFAPKPLCLTAADDWTKEMATKGFPQLQQHYQLFGAADHVQLNALVQFGHNYNYVSRAAMYQWLNEHLDLNHESPIVEKDFPRLAAAELTVWDDQHPKPAGGDEFERNLLRWWTEDTEKQLGAIKPRDEASLLQYKETVGAAIDTIIGRDLPPGKDVEFEKTDKTDRGNYLEIVGLLRNVAHQEEVPIVFLYPKQWEGRVVVWLDKNGKSGLYDGDQLNPGVRRLIEAGNSVIGVDLLFQGEFLADGQAVEQTRRVGNPREAAAYTFGYNHTLFAQRVHDVLSVLSFVVHHDYEPKEVVLVGLDGAGHWAAAARAQARDAVDIAIIDTGGFRFGKVDAIHSPDFLPGGAKYDDILGMLAVATPDPTWLAGESADSAELVAAAYSADQRPKNLQRYEGPKAEMTSAALDWLLGR